jgi:hypothetical protein
MIRRCPQKMADSKLGFLSRYVHAPRRPLERPARTGLSVGIGRITNLPLKENGNRKRH